MDASECALPNEPVVLFLYNPFGTPAMSTVTSNLARSLNAAY